VRQPSFLVEGLESRQLLSSAADILFKPAVQFTQADSTTTTTTTTSTTPINTTVQGYTPAQIRTAYGFGQVTFGSGSTTTADGTGQTIAIVDAYNDPNIVSDLAVFDKQFGLAAPPSLQIVSQTGSTAKLPKTDAGWSGEIALDVEWAHAIAPGANILLVEASSASLSDLMTAVTYARSAPGVSTVSLSWGGSEFFSWNTQGEFSGQTQYDPLFTTPTGHQGVTFVAAAGDSGSFSGVLWPASSPNVVAVGGTTLALTSSGAYGTETTWSGTTGGFSQVETQPAYQSSVQTSGARAVPDVAFNGDPNTGFAVYDSLAYSGYAGWQQVGGTSAGSPIWASLIAIADQGRVASGQGTLDGPTQTLPLLYSVYPTTASPSATTYQNTFNDVIDPAPSGRYHWRWGWGSTGNQSTAGYDTATGLGSPKAASIVDLLTNSSSTGSTTGSGSTGTSGTSGSPTPTPAQLPASPLAAIFVSSFPASVLDGSQGTVRLKITNTASSKFTGPILVDLYASADGTATSSDTLLTSTTLSNVTIKAGGSKIIKLKFNYPSTLSDGNYNITAAVTATGTNTAAATVDSPTKVDISAANVDLATAFASTLPITVKPGAGEDVLVSVQNTGNVTATGSLDLKLYASADSVIDSNDQLLVSLPARQINLKAGKSMTFKIHFVPPLGETPGTYKLIAAASSVTSPADTNPGNDSAVAATV
jgi:subtilase family serine protease